MVRMSNSTTMSFKIDKALKTRAQDTASSIGIPLSNVITIYLRDFANTGRLEVTAAEDMTPQMERVIERFRIEKAKGDLSPAFDTTESAEEYLMSL
jgi:addiction module RelB/DinJ family antitoxin